MVKILNKLLLQSKFVSLSWLIEPLQFEFIRNALILGFFLGILSAIVGSYLIVQQMSMMAGEIAHAVLPGISLAYFLGIDLAIGAFISGIFSALFVFWVQTRSRIKVDAVMTLALTSFLALGVISIEIFETKEIDLSHILFGDILEVDRVDIWQTAIITLIIILLTKIFYQQLLFYTFDPIGAKAYGLPTKSLYLGLTIATTITIVVSIQIVGVLLITSLSIGPAISAYLLVKELHQMMILGSLLGISSIFTGLYLSYYYHFPSGASIVTVISILFILILLFSPTQGILTTPTRRQRLVRITINKLNRHK